MTNVFQRQQELKLWNQAILQDLKCLLLGVGGLGSTIAMDLCRLGVKEIIIIDMDSVEHHNLNRQILYGEQDVGAAKVEAALAQLSFHNIRPDKTSIQHYHFDVLEEWNRTIEFIKYCDVIVNTIDWGDFFDYVICKVAEKFQKPLVLGGTEPFYGHTISYFLQGIRIEDIKYPDCHDLPKEKLTEVLLRLENNHWEDLSNITFLPKDIHPDRGGSTVYSAGTCAHLMVAALMNYIHFLHNSETHPNPPKQVIFNLFTMESNHWF